MPAIDTRTYPTPHGDIPLPAFLPDGTSGVVRGVDARDLADVGTPAVQMNVYHLMQRPGSSTIQALGGLHTLTGWRGPISTDSGGFQVYSLIRQNAKLGSITDRGALFRIEDRKYQLTPEKSIQLQFSYGADTLFCLDDCTHVDDPPEVQTQSVSRTVRWAKACKAEFDRLIAEKQLPPDQRPKLFGVVQGGGDLALRRACAEQLLEIGFDGYGYGGWPLDAQNNLLTEVIAYTRAVIPAEYPMHALGVGHPANVVACTRLGYGLFDSTMPTRDARHGRLYTFTTDHGLDGDFFSYLYIKDDKHIKASGPPSAHLPADVSLGYLHHLYKLGDTLYERLATRHNLRFMNALMARLAAEASSHARIG